MHRRKLIFSRDRSKYRRDISTYRRDKTNRIIRYLYDEQQVVVIDIISSKTQSKWKSSKYLH